MTFDQVAGFESLQMLLALAVQDGLTGCDNHIPQWKIKRGSVHG